MRHEHDDCTPFAAAENNGILKSEDLTTPREFSKHLIDDGKTLVKIEATDRLSNNLDRDPIENLEQLMGHQSLPSVQMKLEICPHTPRSSGDQQQQYPKFTSMSDCLPDDEENNLHLPHIVTKNLMIS